MPHASDALLPNSLSHKHAQPLAYGKAELSLVSHLLIWSILRISLLFAAGLGVSAFWLSERQAKQSWFSNKAFLPIFLRKGTNNFLLGSLLATFVGCGVFYPPKVRNL